MSFDFHAHHTAVRSQDLIRLMRTPPGGSAMTLLDLLAQTIVTEETKLTGVEAHQQITRSAAYRTEIRDQHEMLRSLGLCPPESPNWYGLPRFSCYVRVDFELATPYLGRDDRTFSVTENPVRKDRVFGVPFISATTWKGAFRHACRLVGKDRVDRLFGPNLTDGEEPEAIRGLLSFYPSFFDAVDFEIINPHDRARRIGKNPIRLECVPKGSKSRLGILYVPARAGAEARNMAEQVAQDLDAWLRAAEFLLSDLGISAKRSSGYGELLPELVGEQGVLEIKDSTIKMLPFNQLGALSEVRVSALAFLGGRR